MKRIEREGEFFLQLYFKPHHIEAALLQVANIATQFLVVHLGRLPHFFLEISWWLADRGKSRHVESAVVADGGAVHTSLPALGADPALQTFFPVRLVGVDPVGQLEGRGIELKYRKIAELIAIGIE